MQKRRAPNAASTHCGHNPTFKKHPARPAFEQALRALIPGHISHASVVQLLGNRAQYGAIQGWRFARRKPPEWARSLVAEMLRKDAQTRLAIAAAVEVDASRDCGALGALTLASWRAKEKPRDLAGLPADNSKRD